MSTGSPYPGDIGPRAPDGAVGVYYEEILAVRAPRAETVEAWAERMNRSGRNRCQCGCGAELVVLPRHRSMGLPKYLHGHHLNPLRRGFDRIRENGYHLVPEIAARLGVSPSTLHRMEAEGIIPEARRVKVARGKTVRAYTAEELELIASSKPRERWLAKHPGRWGTG